MIYSINYAPIGGNLWKLEVQLNTSGDCEQKETIWCG